MTSPTREAWPQDGRAVGRSEGRQGPLTPPRVLPALFLIETHPCRWLSPGSARHLERWTSLYLMGRLAMAVQGSGRAPDPKIPVSPPDPTCYSSTMPGTQRALGLRPACLLPGSRACAPRSGPQLSGAPRPLHAEEALLSLGPALPTPVR